MLNNFPPLNDQRYMYYWPANIHKYDPSLTQGEITIDGRSGLQYIQYPGMNTNQCLIQTGNIFCGMLYHTQVVGLRQKQSRCYCLLFRTDIGLLPSKNLLVLYLINSDDTQKNIQKINLYKIRQCCRPLKQLV